MAKRAKTIAVDAPRPLLKTKSFWVGVLLIGAGVVEWVFDGNKEQAVNKIFAGLLTITGRDALLKIENR